MGENGLPSKSVRILEDFNINVIISYLVTHSLEPRFSFPFRRTSLYNFEAHVRVSLIFYSLFKCAYKV